MQFIAELAIRSFLFSAILSAGASCPSSRRLPFAVIRGGASSSSAASQHVPTAIDVPSGGSTRTVPPPSNSSSSSSPVSSTLGLSINGDGESVSSSEGADGGTSTFHVIKRDGSNEPLDRAKLAARLEALCGNGAINTKYVSLTDLVDSIMRGTYPDITTAELDTLASETAASLSTQHPDYARLAARICISSAHKTTPPTFSEAIARLYEDGKGFISSDIGELVKRRGKEIDTRIVNERDFDLTYFGYKTLERAYLLKTDKGEPVERPQYLLMRVALGIHCGRPVEDDAVGAAASAGDSRNVSARRTKEEEDAALEAAFETYDMMSQGYFSHASPTLFHAGTTHPQLSSCFLVQMEDDSINGIYDTLKKCAVISKAAGGIGLSVHNIRARGTHIKGTRGVSNGLVPMLRVYDVTSRYVDQGGGKRPGAFAIYLEPWHADIFDVLNMKKNHGKEEQRARDLFYGLWVPDLFMERVQNDGMWSLMCSHQCQGLQQCHGEEFKRLYEKYESEGKFVRQVRARELWSAIIDAQIETGTPYMLYKDAANQKSNQQNLGTIQCSNLCTEIIQYTDENEVAVCNLASICLSKYVVSNRGAYGSIDRKSSGDDGSTKAYFDHESLHRATKIVTRNLNKVIDVNKYPCPGARLSNRRHRPVGIGVSGLADAFLRMGLPFTSDEAKNLNEAIFETIYHASLEASAELAEEFGAYETFEGSPASKGKLQHDLWDMEDGETLSNRICQDRLSADLAALHRYSGDVVSKQGYDWQALRDRIQKVGLRNSLLVAPMPTASTSQILGVNECFEPFSSNLYVRRVKAGEFILMNPHLLQDLTDQGLWTPAVRNQLMRDGGSVANIECIPDRLKELYKTVWEIKMKDIIDMAADRGKFIDQSQSLNLFIADPTVDKLTAAHFYAWKKGLKTGMYYLRTKPAVNAIQYTVEKNRNSEKQEMEDSLASAQSVLPSQGDEDICLSCSA